MENFHVLRVIALPPTNANAPMVKIQSERFKQSKTIGYSNDPGASGYALETAEKYLLSKGFKIIGQAEGKDCYYIITNTFEPIK